MDRIQKLFTILTVTFLLLLLIGVGSGYNIQEPQTHRDVEKIFLQENNISYSEMFQKCTYPLRMIARGFGKMESGLCTQGASLHNNNCRSLHPGGSKQFRHQKEGWGWRYYGGEPLNIYGRKTAALYDFMSTYYYGYGCKVDLAHIHYYIYGSANYGRNHSREYLNNLKSIIYKF